MDNTSTNNTESKPTNYSKPTIPIKHEKPLSIRVTEDKEIKDETDESTDGGSTP